MKLFCPSCGNAVEFRYDDSFVRVCDACHSALLRSDRGIESLGQFADLAPAASGLELQDRGHWQGQSFVLVGRAEYLHPAGGSWEEWYLRFADQRWGWLSYAQGRWALTFPSTPDHALPGFEAVQPGMQLAVQHGVVLTVMERNQAQLSSAEGEIPFAFVPGAPLRFVDLSDQDGRFATLDYGAPGTAEPQLYIGRAADFAELGLPLRTPAQPLAPAGSAERLGCPNCGGSIELRLPGSSKSVVCPYCVSVLDCEGPLAILSQVPQVARLAAPIPLGAEGSFAGTRYTVTGRLLRAVSYQGKDFEWDEYLLHAPGVGYRWLVCSQGHYSFVSELPPGAVTSELEGAQYGTREFRLFDRGEATVRAAYGEFYWRVSVGEAVHTRDFVAPPWMLSEELSEGELHWSLGAYQSVEQVRTAFGLSTLRDLRSSVAPHEPFLHGGWLRVTLMLALALLLAAAWLGASAKEGHAYGTRLQLGSKDMPGATDAASAGQTYVHFTPSFELAARQNVRISVQMPLANSWAYATVDLIHEASGELSSFGADLSQYSGVEDGESWSEGSESAEHVVAVREGGSYVLRLELQTPAPARSWVALSVTEGVFLWSRLLLAFGVLGLPALAFWVWQSSFERERWSNSDFGPGGGSDAGGNSDDYDESNEDSGNDEDSDD